MRPSKTNFIKITLKMLRAHVMKYSLFCPFKKAIERLSSIIVYIDTSKFFSAMINPAVGCIIFSDPLVWVVLIEKVRKIFIQTTESVRPNRKFPRRHRVKLKRFFLEYKTTC